MGGFFEREIIYMCIDREREREREAQRKINEEKEGI